MIAVVGTVRLCAPLSFQLCRLLGPPRSFEFFLLLSLTVLSISPLVALLYSSALILLLGRARLLGASSLGASSLGASLLGASVVDASLVNPTLLGSCAAPVAAAGALLIVRYHVLVLILATASIVLAALRMCRCRNEQQRCCRRKYLRAFHTFPPP